MNSRKKRFVRLVAALGLVLAIAAIAAPLWFPWLLAPLAHRHGVNYSSYRRIGYTRLELESVSFTNASLIVTARQVRIPAPAVWILRNVRSGRASPLIEARDWQVVLPRLSSKTPSSTSFYTNLQQLGPVVRSVAYWIPNIFLTNGAIIRDQQRMDIRSFYSDRTSFSGTVQIPGLPSFVECRGELMADDAWNFKTEYVPWSLASDVRARFSRSNLAASATLQFLTNRADVSAFFDLDRMLPRSLTFNCTAFRVPGGRLGLPGYEEIAGSFFLLWQTNSFSAKVTAQGSAASSNLPPINVAVDSAGDERHVQVNRFHLATPAVTLELRESVSFPMSSTSPPVALSVTGDFARQRWVDLIGTVKGELLLNPSTNGFPTVQFDVRAKDLQTGNLQLSSARAAGNLEWPFVRVNDFGLLISSNREAQGSATIDVTRKTIAAGQVHYDGPLSVPRANCSADDLSLAIRFEGPLSAIEHADRIRVVGLNVAAARQLNLSIDSSGAGRRLDATGAVAKASSRLAFSVSANAGAKTNQLLIRQLEFGRNGMSRLQMARSAAVSYSRRGAAPGVVMSPLDLSGPAGALEFSGMFLGAQQAHLLGRIDGLSLREFGDFLPPQWQGLRVDALRLEGGWTNAPVAAVGHASIKYQGNPSFTATGSVSADKSGVALSNLLMISETMPVMTASGSLPLTISPGNRGRPWIQMDASGPLRFTAKTSPDPRFWEQFASLTGIQVIQPEALAELGGTWQAPTGTLHASVSRIAVRGTNLPALEQFRLEARFRNQTLLLDPLTFEIQKQPVRLSGEFPIDAQFYESLTKRKLPDWRRGRAHLTLARAPVAAFRRFMPPLLEPLGTFAVNADVRGGQVFGELTLEEVTTVPVGRLGAVRDISGRIQIEQSSLRLDELRGSLGGEPLRIVGNAELPAIDSPWSQIPLFRFRLQGTNIPLAREPQAIIRGDLDLRFLHTNSAPPIISGTVRLRESIYTSDLDALIPGRLSKPAGRPPYFSVETEPMADWRLDCQVKGEEFLKMRTPFFRGAVSTDFNLKGTLREPIASGEATVPKGQVEFPFGTLEVKSALISITAANPFQPQVYLIARARRLGYDITLQVTGPADKPVIQFSSVPSLSSDQILLLLTAGEIPREDFNLTPQQKAQRFAFFFGQRFLNKLGFGGDSERLSIRSGEDVSEAGRQTYDIEFKLDQNWSLVGQYDRFNAFNLSLKRRIYSR